MQRLETIRLTLNQLEISDWSAIQFLRSDPGVNQYVKRPKAKTKDETIQFITRIQRNLADGPDCFWAIRLKSTPELIGTICLWNFSQDRTIAELGYDLHPQHWRQGLMREAVASVAAYAFEKLDIIRLDAYTHHQNRPSIDLLVFFGFEFQKEKKDNDNINNVIYALSHKKWGQMPT